jgi:hypothetical protein
MIPALKTYKGLIIHLSEDDAPTYLSTLDPSLSSFALPQQLASSIAKQNNLPDSAFEVKLSFNCDLMALLPSSLTALTLTRQFDWSPEAPCLFSIPTLEKLVVTSVSATKLMLVNMSSRFPILREVALAYVDSKVSEGFVGALPDTLRSLTVLQSGDGKFRDFPSLPKHLLSLSIKEMCNSIVKSSIEGLPQSLTSLEINSVPYFSHSWIHSLPPSLTFFKCNRAIVVDNRRVTKYNKTSVDRME